MYLHREVLTRLGSHLVSHLCHGVGGLELYFQSPDTHVSSSSYGVGGLERDIHPPQQRAGTSHAAPPLVTSPGKGSGFRVQGSGFRV